MFYKGRKNRMKCSLGISLFLAIAVTLYAPEELHARDYYVGPTGTDDAGAGTSVERPYATVQFATDCLRPGDTLYLLNGTYRNRSYGSPTKDNGPFCSLTVSGTQGQWITIRAYPGHRPIIQFDGDFAFYGKGLSYVRLFGLTIEGVAGQITRDDALTHRTSTPTPNYYLGCGILLQNSHHVSVSGCTVRRCPGPAVKFQQCDYVWAEYNLIHENSFWHKAATCALIVMAPRSIDENDATKIVLRGNVVWGNRNRIPYYDPSVRFGPPGFGTAEFKDIIDGHGILVFDPQGDWVSGNWSHGHTLIEKNVCFANGLNGIKTARLDRITIRRNLVYGNGITVIEQGHRFGTVGVYSKQGTDIVLRSNVVQRRPASDFGENHRFFKAVMVEPGTTVENNVIFAGAIPALAKGTIRKDPQFVSPQYTWEGADFSFAVHPAGFDRDCAGIPYSPEELKNNIEQLEKALNMDNPEQGLPQ